MGKYFNFAKNIDKLEGGKTTFQDNNLKHKKMNKETLIQNLKQKVGETDFNVLSTQTVDGIITPLLPMFADDENVNDTTYELPVQLLKNYIGQYRHDVKAGITAGIDGEKNRLTSEKEAAIAAFKAQWEKDHPADNGGKGDGNGNGTGDNNGGTGMSAEEISKKLDELFATKLSELTGKDGAIGKLNGLLESLESQRKAEKISTITKTIEQYITEKEGGELSHEQSRALHYALKDFTIDAEKPVDDLKKTFEKLYEETYKDLYPNGGMPFANAAGESGSNAAFEDFIKRNADAAKTAEKEQEALKKKFM